MISLITTEPPQDVDENTRFKLPHVASEILMCEVPQISSAISQDEALLEKLFTFMESDSPLNPLLASFFTKAVGNILTRKSEQVSFVKKIFLKILSMMCTIVFYFRTGTITNLYA